MGKQSGSRTLTHMMRMCILIRWAGRLNIIFFVEFRIQSFHVDCMLVENIGLGCVIVF